MRLDQKICSTKIMRSNNECCSQILPFAEFGSVKNICFAFLYMTLNTEVHMYRKTTYSKANVSILLLHVYFLMIFRISLSLKDSQSSIAASIFVSSFFCPREMHIHFMIPLNMIIRNTIHSMFMLASWLPLSIRSIIRKGNIVS